jgi:16S rRNA G966 N2-methylase RsmD
MSSAAQIAQAEQATFQLLPALTDAEYRALKDDIREHGVLVPIEVDDRGNILDGHHRVKAWHELRTEGVKLDDYQRMVRIGMSDAEKRAHAIRLNINRRHLSKDQRRELNQMLATFKNADGTAAHSLPEIAGMTGTPYTTVWRDINKPTCSNEQVDRSPVVRGKDGKNRDAKKPRAVMAKNGKEQERAQQALAILGDDAPVTVVDTKRVERLAREHQAEERRTQPAADVALGTISLWLGDFRERGREIADNSIELIFTDPPYHEEYIPLWSDLGALAARVLKPGGALVSYSGQKYLLTVMQALSEHLDYFWLCAVKHSGGDAQRHVQRIRNGFKPILFYVKPPVNPWWEYMPDIISGGQEKDAHDWQQAAGEARHYIRHLCPSGGVVLDPMCGGGTTLLVSRELGLRSIGIEIAPEHFHAAQERCDGD